MKKLWLTLLLILAFGCTSLHVNVPDDKRVVVTVEDQDREVTEKAAERRPPRFKRDRTWFADVEANFYPFSGGLQGGGSGALDARTGTADKDAGIVVLNDHGTYGNAGFAFSLDAVGGCGAESAPTCIESGDAGEWWELVDWYMMDAYIYGDDIVATTNTLGALWVGDGTNYNPVVMSGDASIDAAGAVTVADDSHAHVYSNIDAFTEANLYTLLSDVTDFVQPAEVDVEMLADVTGEGTAATYPLFDDNDGTYSFRAIAAGDIPNDLIDSQHYAAGSIDAEHLADDAYKIITKSTATNYTIGTTDSTESYGGVIYVTGAATITAPAVVAGMSFTVITIGAVAVSVDVNASDRMYLDGTALDDGDKATNTSTTGDSIVCSYESADGWYCMSGSPDGDNWSDGGA